MDSKIQKALEQLWSTQKEFAELENRIEELRNENEGLREREALYRAFIEHVPDALFAHDLSGRFVYANEVSCLALGYTQEEILNLSVHEVECGLVPEQIQRYWEEVMDGRTVHTEGQLKRKDGSTFPVDIRIGLFDSLENQIIYGIARDISERKQFEKRLRHAQKMEAIGTLAGGIAHDFNNILGIILGCAELAGDPLAETHPSRQYIKEIKLAVLRAKEVVDQLLSYSQKSGRKREPMQIEPIIRESLKFLRATISANIDLRSAISGNCFMVMANPAQIHQMIINLCTNAVQATSGGGIIEVGLKNRIFDHDRPRADAVDLQGRYLQLTVRDTGHGMTPQVKERMFDPYYTTHEAGRGTGMGLAVVHGIVQSLGGRIVAQSEPGKGATFNIFLPAMEISKRRDRSIEVPETPLPMGDERIMLVDDEVLLADSLKVRLEMLGYEVEGFTDPLKAMETFRKTPHRFDLVLTDMGMPVMTGEQLTRQIKQIRADIPVILCTGYSERLNQKTPEALGATKRLFKPIGRETLAQTVRAALDTGKKGRSHEIN